MSKEAAFEALPHLWLAKNESAVGEMLFCRQLEVGYHMHYDEKSLTGSGWLAGRGGGGGGRGGGEGGRAGTHCCCQEGSRGE